MFSYINLNRTWWFSWFDIPRDLGAVRLPAANSVMSRLMNAHD